MAEKAGEIYYDIEADVSGLLKAQRQADKARQHGAELQQNE